MPKERYRFFNGREIEEIILPSKLLSSGLAHILWEIQKWEGDEAKLDNPSPNNIKKLLKIAGFHPDNYRSSYAYAVTNITVKTTLKQAVVEAINQAITEEMEKSPCPDAIIMRP